eukprot:1159091-Pelagomonas_calceolata.AAC.7
MLDTNQRALRKDPTVSAEINSEHHQIQQVISHPSRNEKKNNVVGGTSSEFETLPTSDPQNKSANGDLEGYWQHPSFKTWLPFGETLPSSLVRGPFLNARGLLAGVDFFLLFPFLRHNLCAVVIHFASNARWIIAQDWSLVCLEDALYTQHAKHASAGQCIALRKRERSELNERKRCCLNHAAPGKSMPQGAAMTAGFIIVNVESPCSIATSKTFSFALTSLQVAERVR